jgi:hypothetical protein
LEKEIIGLFSNTFKAPYFEYLVGSSAQSFSDLVVIAERIKQVIRMGRITDPSQKGGFIGHKKEANVHNIEGEGKGRKHNFQATHDHSSHIQHKFHFVLSKKPNKYLKYPVPPKEHISPT